VLTTVRTEARAKEVRIMMSMGVGCWPVEGLLRRFCTRLGTASIGRGVASEAAAIGSTEDNE
jgi:hypothetical protein